MQENHSDCSSVAQQALVLESSDHVELNPLVPAQPANTALKSSSSQESVKPKSLCLAARVSAFKEQHFQEAVAAQTETPQRESTRSVSEAKWTIFKKEVP